jgi:hypothetical protein
LIEDYLHHTRQDGIPACDTCEHPGTGTRERGNAGTGRQRCATNVDPQRILKIARDLFLLGEVLSNLDKLRHIRTFAQ